MPNQLNVYFTADPSSPMDPLDAPSDAIIFYAALPFTIHVYDRIKHWDGTISYSTDYSSWSTWDGTTTLTAVKTGYWYRIYMKGSSNTYITSLRGSGSIQAIDRDANRRWVITNTGTDVVMCKGDFTKLLGRTSINKAGCFANMFQGNAFLDFDIVLPKTGNYAAVFANMFAGCSSMTKAPDITSTTNIYTLACSCMFRKCSLLKTPPTITVATASISNYGCYGMFESCPALTSTIPLNFSVASYGCSNMFRECHNITTVDLSGLTTSSTYACQYMFYECMNLTTITALPTGNLQTGTFQYAFARCPNLVNLPTSTTMTAIYTATNVWDYMFQYCTALTTVNNLTFQVASGTGTKGGYNNRGTFQYCWGLTDLTGLTLDDSLPYSYAFQYMFQGCTALVNPPVLPNASTIYAYMYASMFYGCTALTSAPIIKGTQVNSYGCNAMFYGCTALTTPPKLPATTLSSTYNYYQMFRGCTNLTALPELPTLTLTSYCYAQMFYGCTKIKLSTTQTGDYQTAYRIPPTGTGETASNAFSSTFTSTGGTFTGTAAVNTTYYTSNTIVSAT